MEKKRLPILCPSATIDRPGAKLLGVVDDAGRLAMLSEPRAVTPEFAQIATRGRDPHLRFRFTATCGRATCGSWENGRCGAVEIVADALEPAADDALPDCAIRPTCRWFVQRGAAACRVCPQVVHSLFVEPEPAP